MHDARLPALRPPPARRVHRSAASAGRRRRRSTDPDARDFDEVWIFDNPDGVDDRALVPRRRLPALADGPPRHVDRPRRSRSADGRRLRGPADRDRRPRPGAVRRRRRRGAARRSSPRSSGQAAFVVTDAGVVRSGVAGRVVDLLARRRPRASSSSTASSRTREPRRSSAGARVLRALPRARRRNVGRRRRARRRLGDGLGQGRSPSTRPTTVMSCHLATTMKRSRPGVPVIAIPTTAGTGAETNTVRRDHRRGRRAQGLRRPRERPADGRDPRSRADPRPAARPDRRDRRRRADPLARVAPVEEPEPVRRGDRARRDPDGRGVAAAGRRRRHGPRGAQPDAPRRPLRGRRPAERDGRRRGPRDRPRDRDARPAAPTARRSPR